LAAALLTAVGVAVAALPGLAQQQAAPAENKGVATDVLSAFALGGQGLDDYAQREIRMRRITVEPGGVVGLHGHGQRPALTYILSGALTEHREGGPERTYNPGEVITETTAVDHWAENRTGEPVVLISVDLFKG
jgi:quercetin dioxygenase-like cupin family protein